MEEWRAFKVKRFGAIFTWRFRIGIRKNDCGNTWSVEIMEVHN